MVSSIIVVISCTVTASCLLRRCSTVILRTVKLALMVMKIFPGDATGSEGAVGALVGLDFEDFGFLVLSWGCGVDGGRDVLDFIFLDFPDFPCLLALPVHFSCCSASLPTLAI